MQLLIQNQDPQGAAQIAMQNPNFYSIVIKNWAKTMTNVDKSSRVDFNDFAATVVGMIRDNKRFDQVMYADVLYTDNGTSGVSAYAPNNNDHYRELESNRANLMTVLQERVQSQMNGIPDTAGVFTTRAAGEAFFTAGTNRRVTRFAFMNFLCRDYEALHDITVPDIHVRRDVERNPGGDSRTYKNNCVGCHAGQDSISGAWAYFDFPNDQLVYTANTVAPKINNIVSYPEANMVTNDSFDNLWVSGQNASLGWRGSTSGNGGRQLMQMLSRTRAFSECMAERAYKLTCLKEPKQQAHVDALDQYATQFETTDNYNMKTLLAKTATLCLGE